MPTDVIMPQMGESIFEGTITKWLKKPGDKVQRDEPLFEISTDKVDAEIPAPASGVLKEIKVSEGATVQVNTVVGVIDVEGAPAAASTAKPQQPAQSAARTTGGAASTDGPTQTKASPQADDSAGRQPPATENAPVVQESGGGGSNGGPGTEVVMPQMGESIFEGTITKWLKKVGDKVQRDEPLFEISTDKVDAEIPAPASGVLREIKASEGSTVQVNSVVAVIGGAGAPAQAQPAAAPAAAARQQETARIATEERPAAVQPSQPQRDHVIDFPATDRGHDGERLRSSPLVRRIARENNVDLHNVPGTGLGGRITKNDIQSFIQQHGPSVQGRPAAPPRQMPQPQAQPMPQTQQQPQAQPQQRPAAAAATPAFQEIPGELVPMTPMRRKIAERMVESRRTSAHVHTVFKVDMTRVVKLREKIRKQWEARNGIKLTFMPFIAKALMHGIRTKPIVNSSVAGDSIQYHKNINIGIAVALEWGLIVPVVKGAENLSFVGLQRAIIDLGERARSKKLVPDEVQGGTITITNPGIFGPQFGTPIILQPQVAILGMGGIFKEPVVITDEDGNDSIAVRHIIRLVLGYDHRIIDGADADQFMVAVRSYLENFNEDIG
ncbi:MAG: 2-oxoglutarate dehydrogenase, E2 component, dihydrolipoamide succinyltransferase [Candidatus Angelobacter sp. Gp1-AA117]|nr:MAG: 2-oxoglutarate dehydrogenase, E2 component, dihydrolipoamide succinyltransferase [Candidatus Angelobacter sp. Gp1-AA117]